MYMYIRRNMTFLVLYSCYTKLFLMILWDFLNLSCFFSFVESYNTVWPEKMLLCLECHMQYFHKVMYLCTTTRTQLKPTATLFYLLLGFPLFHSLYKYCWLAISFICMLFSRSEWSSIFILVKKLFLFVLRHIKLC